MWNTSAPILSGICSKNCESGLHHLFTHMPWWVINAAAIYSSTTHDNNVGPIIFLITITWLGPSTSLLEHPDDKVHCSHCGDSLQQMLWAQDVSFLMLRVCIWANTTCASWSLGHGTILCHHEHVWSTLAAPGNKKRCTPQESPPGPGWHQALPHIIFFFAQQPTHHEGTQHCWRNLAEELLLRRPFCLGTLAEEPSPCSWHLYNWFLDDMYLEIQYLFLYQATCTISVARDT